MTTVESIADLSNLSPWDGQTVQLKSYHPKLNLGKAICNYNAANKNINDGYINLNGWTLDISSNRVTVHQLGIKSDGTDEGVSLNMLVSYLASYAKSIDTPLTLTSNNLPIIVSTTVNVDTSWVRLENILLTTTASFNPTTSTPILHIDATTNDQSNTVVRLKNVVVKGPGWRTTNPVHGVYIRPSASMKLGNIQGLCITDVNYGIVLGSNAYLITFTDCVVSRCGVNLVDSVTAQLETSTTNCGENISFNHCALGESNQIAKISNYNGVSHFSFTNVSFDYNGGQNKNNIAFDLTQGEYDFHSCHFESGNVNDGIHANYFNVSPGTNVSLFGGWIMFNANYNQIPYFFYTTSVADRGKQSMFNVYGTAIYAPGVQWWMNAGMGEFKPNIEISDYTTSGNWQQRNTLMLNGDVKNTTNLVDFWYVGFNSTLSAAKITQTNITTTSQMSVSATGSGILVSRLISAVDDATKGGMCYLLVPRPRSRYNPNLTVTYHSDQDLDISANKIYITCEPVQWMGQFDTYGLPTNINPYETIGSATISTLSKTSQSVSPVTYAAQSDMFQNCNYILVTINFSTITAATNLYLTNISLSQPN